MHQGHFAQAVFDTVHKPRAKAPLELISPWVYSPWAVGSASIMFMSPLTLRQGQCLAQRLEEHISSLQY